MKKTIALLVAACGLQLIAYAQQPIYKNKNVSPEVRTKDLLSRMTLDEKLMQLQCIWQQKSSFMTNGEFDEAKAQKILKNGLGEIARINADMGPANPGLHPKEAANLYNKVQKFFVEKTRLGIPVMVHEEGRMDNKRVMLQAFLFQWV